jgi:hypothetical protein
VERLNDGSETAPVVDVAFSANSAMASSTANNRRDELLIIRGFERHLSSSCSLNIVMSEMTPQVHFLDCMQTAADSESCVTDVMFQRQVNQLPLVRPFLEYRLREGGRVMEN